MSHGFNSWIVCSMHIWIDVHYFVWVFSKEVRHNHGGWCNIDAIIQQLSSRLSSFSLFLAAFLVFFYFFSFSHLFVRVRVRVLNFFPSSLLNKYPVIKTSCCYCYNYICTLIDGSYYANSREKKKKRTEEKKDEKKEEEKENSTSYSTGELCVHACTQKALLCERERITYWHNATRVYMLSRRIEEEKYMENHTQRGQNKAYSTMLVERMRQREKKKKNVLFLIFLDVVAVVSYPTQTDCFLLYCDCTIECYYIVVSYSFSYHQWRRLIKVYIAFFCLRVIRLENMQINIHETISNKKNISQK